MRTPRIGLPVARAMRHVGWLLCAGFAAPGFSQEESRAAGALDFTVAYTGDLRRNTTGGIGVGSTYSHELDLAANWSSDQLFSDARVTGSVAVMYLGGGDISSHYVGDLQGLNNLEAPDGWRLYESWMQVSFGDSASNLRAGVLDLNAEFDTPVTQGLFIGSPFGIGTEFSQTGANGPVVWPTTGLGIRAAGAVGERVAWRVGAYDGVPGDDASDFTDIEVSGDDGALLIGELEYSSGRIHKLSVGSWAYTAAFERIDAELTGAPPAHGNHGFYGTFDLSLGSLGAVNFDGALRAGTAPARFNAIDRYVGVALTATRLTRARPDDSLGFGIAWAHVGAPYAASSEFDGSPPTSAETLFELVYRADVTPWLALVPNVQYVADPGALQGVGDSWVVGLRFEMARNRQWIHARDNNTNDPDGSYARRQP